MRIGILTNYHLEQVGGAEEALDRLATHWLRLGCQPLLFASPSRRAGGPKRPWQPAYPCHRLPRPFSTRWGLSRYLWHLAREHRRQPLDLVLASDVYWPGHVARLFRHRSGVPYVLYSHGGDCMQGSRFLRRGVCRKRMAQSIAQADGVTCISHYVRGRLEALAQPTGPVRWLPNGWPDEWAQAAPTRPLVQWPYLFAMGRMIELKGFQTLLAAYVRLRARFPRLGLIVAGDGPYREGLWRQAQMAGLAPTERIDGTSASPTVVLPGFVHGDEKRALVEHALLGVCPSIREEPQGMVVLEMLCRGVPVVASRVGGIPDMIQPGLNGELFRAGDDADLAQQLSTLLGEPEQLAARRRQAAPSVAELPWSRVAERYLELFHEVLANHRRAAA